MSGKKQCRGASWFLSVAMANSSDSSSSREKEFILAIVQAYKPFTRAGTLSRWSHHTPRIGNWEGCIQGSTQLAFSIFYSPGPSCPGNGMASNSDMSSRIISIIKTILHKHVHRPISLVILDSVKLRFNTQQARREVFISACSSRGHSPS